MRTGIAAAAVLFCVVFADNLRSQGQAPGQAQARPPAVSPQRTLINQYLRRVS